jgi:VWFA-related protein
MPASYSRSLVKSGRVALAALPTLLLFPSLSSAQQLSAQQPSAQESSVQAPPAAALPGGKPSAASATPDSPAMRPPSTPADEISLDLTVRSKHNKLIRDLQPSQLAITDDGSPVELSSLRLISGAPESQHLVTLVFDRLNPAAAKAARGMAEKILDVFPAKGYSFAVFQVNGRLHLLQPYTQDRRLIDAAAAYATPALPAPPTADFTPAEKTLLATAHGDAPTLGSQTRAEQKLILSALEQSQRILEDGRTRPSLAALQALALSNRLLTGRKFIVYFSAGIDSNLDTRDTLHSIVGLANRAGVTICVIETNPLDAQLSSAQQAQIASSILGKGDAPGNISSFGVGSLGSSAGNGSAGFAPGAGLNSVSVHNVSGFAFGDVDSSQSPLAPLASGTGGVYIHASGSSKRQLEQLHEDLTNWYEASWVPPIKNYDGRFRPIAIRTLRKDLVIRTRSGYFAVPPTESSAIRPFEMPLLNILAGSALPADVAFHAGILHLGALPDGNSGELVVQLPIAQLEVHEDVNSHISSADAAIVAVIRDSKGAVLERFGEDFPLHEASDRLRIDPGQAITLQRYFSADPGVYTLETAVMDRLSSKAGAQRTTFSIEPSPQGPALSDVALVENVEPDQQDSETFEPMRYGDGRVVPDLATVLPQDTRSLSLFFLIHPVSGSQSQPALRMQIFRDHQLLSELPMELRKVSGAGAAVPYLGSIHGQVFPPGEYQVKALLSQDGSTASSSVSFRVDGSSAASNSPNPSLTAVGSSTPEEDDSHVVSEAAAASSSFVLTSPANPVPPPTDAEVQAMIEGARQRALAWTDTLENFFCLELTNHSVDATGHGDWKHKDTLVELMRYVDHGESRSTLMLNGDRSNAQPDQLQFTHSAGEFGAVFHLIFDPSAKTAFTWKQTAVLDGQPVQVFAFQVARANSGFSLSDRENHILRAGFHGLLYLDPATLSVRRVSIDADDIPRALLIRASSLSVEYSWISMQGRDFLLPARGAVSLQETRRRPVLNEFEFHNYHRFGSVSHILSDEELKDLSKN